MASRLLGKVDYTQRDDQADLKSLKDSLKDTILKTSLEASALKSRRSALQRAQSAQNERSQTYKSTAKRQDNSGKNILDVLFRGHAENEIEFKAGCLSVFISSTFSDFLEERATIAREAYTTIRALCNSVSIDFQLQDLRVNISDWSFNENTFSDITKYVVEKCQRNNRYVLLVLLLGDRYGYRPLPHEIPSEVFNVLSALAKKINPDCSRILGDWYKEDYNATPSVFILQEIGKMKEVSSFTSFVNMPDQFNALENQLRSLILTASALAIDLSKLPPSIDHKLDIGIVQKEAERCMRLLRKKVAIQNDSTMTLFQQADVRVVAYLRSSQYFMAKHASSKACNDHPLMRINFVDWHKGVDGSGAPCMKLNNALYCKQLNVKGNVRKKLAGNDRAVVLQATMNHSDADDKFQSELKEHTKKLSETLISTVSNMLLSASSQSLSIMSTPCNSTLYFGSEVSLEGECAHDVLKDWLIEELLFHAKFCDFLYNSARDFARSQAIEQASQAAKQYLRVQKEKAPFVLVAPAYCGISTLVATLIKAEIADACLSDAGYACLYRFVSQTHLSSTIYSLLYTVVFQLCYVYDVRVDRSFLKNSQTLLNYIRVLVTDQGDVPDEQNRAGSHKPVVTIIFDGLESLVKDPELELFLSWLPEQLPLNINWIITWSLGPDEEQRNPMLDWLRTAEANPSSSVYRITQQGCIVSDSEVRSLLSHFLSSSKGRKLTQQQVQFIVDKFGGKPLNYFYLRLVFQDSLTWHSYSSMSTQISFKTDTFRDFINVYFSSMLEKFPGTSAFVRYTLGYISVAPFGCSEAEVLDLLSSNQLVMTEISNKEHLGFVPDTQASPGLITNPQPEQEQEQKSDHRSESDQKKEPVAAKKCVPPLYFARIMFEIRRFLCECVSDKKLVIQWCSSEFARCAIEMFFPSDTHTKLHEDFVRYYLSRKRGANSYRILRCLPFHCLKSGRLEMLNSVVLFNLEFLTDFMNVFGLEQLVALVTEMLERSRLLVDDIGDTMMMDGRLHDAQRAIDEMFILQQSLRFLHRVEQQNEEDFKQNWTFYLLNILTESGNYDPLFENLLTGVKRFTLSEEYPSISVLSYACKRRVHELSGGSGSMLNALCAPIPRIGLCGNSLRVQYTDVVLIEKPLHQANQTMFACYRKRGQKRQVLIQNSYYLSTFASIHLGSKPADDVRMMHFRADLIRLFVLNQVELCEYEVLTGRMVKKIPLLLEDRSQPSCFVVSTDAVWIAVGYPSALQCFLQYEPKPLITLKNCHATFCMLFTPQKLLVTAHLISPAVGHEAEVVLNIWDYVAQNLYGKLEFERVSKLVGVPQNGLLLCDGVSSTAVLFACQNGTVMIIDCLAVTVLWRYDPLLRNVVSQFSIVPRLLDLSVSQSIVRAANASTVHNERIHQLPTLRVVVWLVECRPGETCVNVLDVARRKHMLSYMNDDLLDTHGVQFASVTVYERETDRVRQFVVLIGTKRGRLLRLTLQEYKHSYASPITRTSSLLIFTESADLMLDDPIGFDLEQRRSNALFLCVHRAMSQSDKLLVLSYSRYDQSLHTFLLDDLATRATQPVMLARETTLETLTSIREEPHGDSTLLDSSISAHVHLTVPYRSDPNSMLRENIDESVLLLTGSRVFQSWNVSPRFVHAEREFVLGGMVRIDKMELINVNVLGSSTYVLVLSGSADIIPKRKGRTDSSDQPTQTISILVSSLLEDALSSSFPRGWQQLPHVAAPDFWIRANRHPLIYALNVVDELHCRITVYTALDLQPLKRVLIRTPWNNVKRQEVVREMRLNSNERYLILLYQLQLEDHRHATLRSYEACAVYLGSPAELLDTGATEEKKLGDEMRGLIFCSNFAESNVNTTFVAGRIDEDQRSALLLFNSIRHASRRVQLNTRFYSIADFGESEMILGTQGDLVVWELGDQQLLEQAQRMAESKDADAREADQLAAEASTKSCVHQVYQDAIPSWFHHSMTEIITRSNPRAVRQNPLEPDHFSFVREPVTAVLVCGLRDKVVQAAELAIAKKRADSPTSSELNSETSSLKENLNLPQKAEVSGKILPEYVLTGCANGTVIIWRWRMLKTASTLETETLHTYRTVVYRPHSEAVTALCVSTDYRLVASGSNDRFVCLIDIENGNVLKRIGVFVNVKNLRFFVLFPMPKSEFSKANSPASEGSTMREIAVRFDKAGTPSIRSNSDVPHQPAGTESTDIGQFCIPILHVVGYLTPKREYLQYFRISLH